MPAQNNFTLIGPFRQIVTLEGLALNGPVTDESLHIISNGGIIVQGGRVITTGSYKKLKNRYRPEGRQLKEVDENFVLLPGLVDAHTHICFAGSRAGEYAMRVSGKSYLEIARSGGGILSSVSMTRKATRTSLLKELLQRCGRHLAEGVTTCEVKSGYGLDVQTELKMLEVINDAGKQHSMDLVPTCLAAHKCPPEFSTPSRYLGFITEELLPVVRKRRLAQRVDIYVDEGAFSEKDALRYLRGAEGMGFSITVHADQFRTGGSRVAARVKAISADHLEASGAREIRMLVKAGVTGVTLPGASMGLGEPYAAARKMLDAGMCMAIASDWNPGSAPMGDLLMQASVYGAAQKLSIAETWSAITFRAAHALGLADRGTLSLNQWADMIAFPCKDYREIFYQQGKLKPSRVWKKGKEC